MPPTCTTLTSISLLAAHSPVVILRPTNGNRDDAHQLAESRALQDQNASSTSYLLPNLRTAFSDEKPGIELRTGVVVRCAQPSAQPAISSSPPAILEGLRAPDEPGFFFSV
jgi:hypothetical protein